MSDWRVTCYHQGGEHTADTDLDGELFTQESATVYAVEHAELFGGEVHVERLTNTIKDCQRWRIFKVVE